MESVVGHSIFKRHEYICPVTTINKHSQITIWVVKPTSHIDDLIRDNGIYQDNTLKNKAWASGDDENYKLTKEVKHENRIYSIVEQGNLMRKYKNIESNSASDPVYYILQGHVKSNENQSWDRSVVLIMRTTSTYDCAVPYGKVRHVREMEIPNTLTQLNLDLYKNDILKMIEIIIHDWKTENKAPSTMLVRIDENIKKTKDASLSGVKRKSTTNVTEMNTIYQIIGEDILVKVMKFTNIEERNTTVHCFIKEL